MYGIDIEEEDLEALLGEDDNDFLGNLTSLIAENGIFDTADDFLRELGIPTVYVVNIQAMLEITGGNE